MEARRESYAGPVARALAAALAEGLLARYDGREGSAGEPPATHFDPPAGYVAAGYAPIPRYGPYGDDERSVCFEKRLYL